MRIRKIKFRDDVLLGSLELNFLNFSTGKPYENVVFVGENGVGKTTVLSLLKHFLDRPERCYFYNYVEYETKSFLSCELRCCACIGTFSLRL